jgi:hypothetical protein
LLAEAVVKILYLAVRVVMAAMALAAGVGPRIAVFQRLVAGALATMAVTAVLD